MRKLPLLISGLVLLSIFTSCKNDDNATPNSMITNNVLLGKWQSETFGVTDTFSFNDDFSGSYVNTGPTSEGEFTAFTEWSNFTYTIDYIVEDIGTSTVLIFNPGRSSGYPFGKYKFWIDGDILTVENFRIEEFERL